MNFFIYLLMILAMAGWGMSWVNTKILTLYVNEYELFFLRGVIGATVIFLFLLFSKRKIFISLKNFLFVLLSSVFMVTYMKYFFLGVKFGTASLGGVLVSVLMPINTFLLMVLFRRKKVKSRDIFSLTTGVIGILIIIKIWTFDTKEIFLKQNIYFFFSSLAWPFVTFIGSKIKISMATYTFYLYLISSILVFIFFIDAEILISKQFDMKFWINLLSLTLIATVFSTIVFFTVVEKKGSYLAHSFMFLIPIFAIFFSVIFLKEKITLSSIFGITLALVAVKTLNSKKNQDN